MDTQEGRNRPRSLEYRLRVERAATLALAISDTHPDDARQILAAALTDLSAGCPHPAFASTREDAQWWCSIATPVELLEYTSAGLKALGQKALCLDMRKRLFAALWRAFAPEERAAFLKSSLAQEDPQ